MGSEGSGDRGRVSREGALTPRASLGRVLSWTSRVLRESDKTLFRMSFLVTARPQGPQPTSMEQDVRQRFH